MCCSVYIMNCWFFFQAEDGIRDLVRSRGLGDVYKRQAVVGPITYDLVSLFKDAYIRWDEERILDWMIRYWEKARKAGLPVSTDFAEFYRDFEWMGVQRQLKVLGIFARLYHRDGKPAYLADMPRVAGGLRGSDLCGQRLGPFRPCEEAPAVQRQRHGKGLGLPGFAEHRIVAAGARPGGLGRTHEARSR